MNHSDTVLKQLIAVLPRYEFDALAKVHHAGRKFRSYNRYNRYNRWSQFLAMLIGQLSGRKSLRDITGKPEGARQAALPSRHEENLHVDPGAG